MNTETLGSRIRQKRKELKLSQMQLAQRMSNCTHASISQWEKDLSKPNAENVYELSVALNCDIYWLLKGVSVHNNVAPAPVDLMTSGKLIPVLHAEKVIQCHRDASFHSSNEDESIMIDSPTAEYCFAYRVTDDSMKPLFFEDDLVVFDTSLKPEPGEFVLARVDCCTGLVFRKFSIESIAGTGECVFKLTPVADEYPLISSQQHEIEIIGVMVEHRIYRKKRR